MNLRPDPSCKRCILAATARTVCVAGRSSAGLSEPEDPVDVLLFGEAPGPEEDAAGVCFVGKAGGVLDVFLGRYLTGNGYRWVLDNAGARCYPGKNRGTGTFLKPSAATMLACRPFNDRLVERLKPRIIVALGNYALSQATGVPVNACKITRVSGTVMESRWGIPVLPLEHPSWVARNPEINGAKWSAGWARLVEWLETGVIPAPEVEWDWVEDAADVKALVQEVRKASASPRFRLCFDYETTGLDPRKAIARMVGYCWDGETAKVMPLLERRHREAHKKILGYARACIHHTMAEQEWSEVYFGRTPEWSIDTKALAFLVDENLEMDLESLVETFLPELAGYKEKTKGLDWSTMPANLLAERCALDTVATYRLARVLDAKLDEKKKDLYIRVVEPGLRTVAACKVRGWAVDVPYLRKLEQDSRAEMDAVSGSVAEDPGFLAWYGAEWKAAGTVNPPKVNLNSVFQKGRVLAHLGMVPLTDCPDCKVRLAESGADLACPKCRARYADERLPSAQHLLSSSREVLGPRSHEHPLVGAFLRLKGLQDLLDRQVTPMLEAAVAGGGLVYPGYNWGGQTQPGEASGTITARLSAARGKDKAYLNLLNPTDEIRQAVVSRFPGGEIISADYSGVEVRIAASIANDRPWVEALLAGADIHRQTGAIAFGVPEDQVTKDQRSAAKTINFAVLYGAGPGKVYRVLLDAAVEANLKRIKAGEAPLRIDRAALLDMARTILSRFWDAHPDLARYKSGCRMAAASAREVAGLFGQVLHLPPLEMFGQKEQEHLLNRAMNFPIQNAGGYATLHAMGRVEAMYRKKGMQALVIGQMHDSIISDVPPGEGDEVEKVLRDCMTAKAEGDYKWLRVPLPVEITRGRTLAG